MGKATRYDLVADAGLWFNEPLVCIGDDFTGATFRMQVRANADAGGSPLANLATVTSETTGVRLIYAGTDTVTNHIAAGRLTADDAAELGFVGTDSVTLSVLRIYISATIMGTIPAPSIPGHSVDHVYDLLATLPGAFENKEFYGAFSVQRTVTR